MKSKHKPLSINFILLLSQESRDWVLCIEATLRFVSAWPNSCNLNGWCERWSDGVSAGLHYECWAWCSGAAVLGCWLLVQLIIGPRRSLDWVMLCDGQWRPRHTTEMPASEEYWWWCWYGSIISGIKFMIRQPKWFFSTINQVSNNNTITTPSL